MQPYPLLIIVNAKLYEFLFPKWVQSKTKLLPFHFIPFFLLVLFDEKKKMQNKKTIDHDGDKYHFFPAALINAFLAEFHLTFSFSHFELSAHV